MWWLTRRGAGMYTTIRGLVSSAGKSSSKGNLAIVLGGLDDWNGGRGLTVTRIMRQAHFFSVCSLHQQNVFILSNTPHFSRLGIIIAGHWTITRQSETDCTTSTSALNTRESSLHVFRPPAHNLPAATYSPLGKL